MISVDQQERVFARFRKECEKHGVIPTELTYERMDERGHMVWSCKIRGTQWRHASQLGRDVDGMTVERQAQWVCEHARRMRENKPG